MSNGILEITSELPTWLNALMAAAAAAMGTFATLRRSSVEATASLSHMQNENAAALLEQNNQLLQSMNNLRKELDASFARITELNREVVQLRSHIESLEAALQHVKEATP